MTCYYFIPFNELPATLPSNVWIATFSASNTQVVWSQKKPDSVPSGTCVCGVSVESGARTTSGGVTSLGTGGKEIPPPQSNLVAANEDQFKAAFTDWVASNRTFDLGSLMSASAS